VDPGQVAARQVPPLSEAAISFAFEAASARQAPLPERLAGFEWLAGFE
jgi:hypothetical protein